MPLSVALSYAQAVQVVPFAVTLAPAEEMALQSVTAVWNASGASGSFLACLSIYSQSGQLLSRTFPVQVLSPGDSGEVTYSLPLGKRAPRTIAAIGNGALATFAAAGSIVVGVPAAVQQNDLIVVALAFEDVTPGSGPWIDHVPQLGWTRLLYQEPSALGSGLEVWYANWYVGPSTTFVFGAAQTGVAREVGFRTSDGSQLAVFVSDSQAVVGSNVACPTIDTSQLDSLACIAIADTQTGPGGYGLPVGYVQEFDNTRAGFGTVEVMVGDGVVDEPGSTGPLPLTFTASPAGAAGSTATFEVGST